MGYRLGLYFVLIFGSILWSQPNASINVEVDTTELRIGEQLNYALIVKTDSLLEVEFPANPNFAPFEILEERLTDTTEAESHYLFTKKYALIQFDSGNYVIPQQAVFVNGFARISDSIPIRVNTVVVDTLKQKMFDIKPLVEVTRDYNQLIRTILIITLILLLVGGIVYTYFFRKRQKSLKEQELSTFEKALKKLKTIGSKQLKTQRDYKEYYTELINVLRVYLEDETDIDAMERTSRELIEDLLKQQELNQEVLDKETIEELEKLLNSADLVKFAQYQLDRFIAQKDLKFIQEVVVKIRENLPEPSEEELQQEEEYRIQLRKKRKKQQLVYGLTSFLGLIIIGLVISMIFYGYYPVRDTILGYNSLKLLNSEWVGSQYGSPPVFIETPQVPVRRDVDDDIDSFFEIGELGSGFYLSLSHEPFSVPPTDPQNPSQELDGQQFVSEVVEEFERLGAINILIDGNNSTLPKGESVIMIEGSIDYPESNNEGFIRCNLKQITVVLEQSLIKLRIIYPREDRYADQIEGRILESIEILREL